VEYMRRAWQTDRLVDPYYSPNLTRAREDFSLCSPLERVVEQERSTEAGPERARTAGEQPT
jgi:hypothetical protein